MTPYFLGLFHDDVIKWKHFPRYWPFVRGIHRSPVNFPHKGQWRGALMFSLIGVWINGWVNSREVGDLRRYRAHYDVIVMLRFCYRFTSTWTHHRRILQPHENSLSELAMCNFLTLNTQRIIHGLEWRMFMRSREFYFDIRFPLCAANTPK